MRADRPEDDRPADRHHPAGLLLGRATAAARSAGRALALRYRSRRAERALTALDDRTLKDLGLGRAEAASAARGGRGRTAPPDRAA